MDIVSLLLSKKYVEDSLNGAGALKGKTAYEVAQDNGFQGTEQDWLVSLRGTAPHIGENGHWFIGDNDSGVIASPSLAGFATEEFVSNEISKLSLSFASHADLIKAIEAIIIPDISGLASESWVKEEIARVQLEGSEVDLTNYFTKEEVKNYVDQQIEFENIQIESLTHDEILAIIKNTETQK